MKQVVEYQGIPVGVLIPREGCLAFMAVKYDVIELDGERFSSAAEARAAVQVQMRRRDLGIPVGSRVADAVTILEKSRYNRPSARVTLT